MAGPTPLLRVGPQVYAAGETKFGQAGPDPPKKKETATVPVLVPGISNAVKVRAISFHFFGKGGGC